MSESSKTIALVKVREKLLIRIPYTSHNVVLTAAITNMASDTSFVDFDL